MLPVTAQGCTADQFRCGSGECVALTDKCNRRIDCIDESDEADCGEFHFRSVCQLWVSCGAFVFFKM